MIKLIQSEDPAAVAVEFEGKTMKDDMEELEAHIEEKFPGEEKFKIFAFIHDMKNATFQGMTEGMKFDTKYWKRIRKVAVVSEQKKWKQVISDIGNYWPGVKIKHFEYEEKEAAWEWLKR
ncbi:STAS/SEC14 domain-containing protein [Evansella clarkii]|uniref:STAS/SEC14 domain-containing protein n=1 Tax=Evansella clarkii TaxID=79879 RepID=UPI000998B9AC|nr:STAS/SEC14 domain-containing protein [Evansella clarkii]